MRIKHGSKKHRYVVRVCVFLITIALIAGIVGCDDGSYVLAISSTEGGSVIAPGEGTFTYNTTTVVDLVAESEDGYYFVGWTGDVDTIASISAATTTITMTGDYEITANFEQIPPGQFALTLSSTIGGSVTVPGEGTFIYGEGTLVSLVANPEDDYHFATWTGDADTVAGVNAAATSIAMDDNCSITANFRPEYNPTVATGWAHTVGVKSDGSVVAVGDSDFGQCDVNDWMDITQIGAGYYHTVGLKSDGTAIAAGWNDEGQCDVVDWVGITQVAAGYYHTVGLKSDGTVVAVGDNSESQCDVGNWTNVVQIAAGGSHTVGLRSDGTVVAAGWNDDGQCDVIDWMNITQVAAGRYHTVGLKSDGTVVAAGEDDDGQCNVGSWTDITQVAAGGYHTVGRRTDGSVVAMGNNNFGKCDVGDWAAIIKVAAGGHHTAGLKSNGTVVAVGWNDYGQCDVGDWMDIT